MENLLVIIILSGIAGILTLVTILGNLLVIIAFKSNRKLQTLSNFCLVSLAISDLTVGIILMPVYTVYLLIGYWPLGPLACDIWLCLDYGLCTASLANLLVIALDRHWSVTRPLTYRARRTPKKMGMMIASAWLVSFLIWPPWIFAWPYIDGERIVPEAECYVQFLQTNVIATTITSSMSFYVPAIVTTMLYLNLYVKTVQRRRRKKVLSQTLLQNCKPEDSIASYENQEKTTPSVKETSKWCLCCPCGVRSENYELDCNKNTCELYVIKNNFPLEKYEKRKQTNVINSILYKKGDCKLEQENIQKMVAATDIDDTFDIEKGVLKKPNNNCISYHNFSRQRSVICLNSEYQRTKNTCMLSKSLSMSFKTKTFSSREVENDTIKLFPVSTGESESTPLSYCNNKRDMLNGEEGPYQERNVGKCSTGRSVSEHVCEIHYKPLSCLNNETSGKILNSAQGQHQDISAATAPLTILEPICELSSTPLTNANKGRAGKILNGGPVKHHDGRTAKILSATLLSLIITSAPYYTFAVIGAYCSGCINPVFHGIGKQINNISFRKG